MSKIPTHEEIEVRAYELYLDCGCGDGHDVQHWLEAEEELAEADAQEAEVPANVPAIESQARTAVAGRQSK